MTKITMLRNHGVTATGRTWLAKGETYVLEDAFADQLVKWGRAQWAHHDDNDASTLWPRREKAVVSAPEKRAPRKRVTKNDQAGQN